MFRLADSYLSLSFTTVLFVGIDAKSVECAPNPLSSRNDLSKTMPPSGQNSSIFVILDESVKAKLFISFAVLEVTLEIVLLPVDALALIALVI